MKGAATTARSLAAIHGLTMRAIAPEILAACSEVARVSMAGFSPPYDVQAAVAAVAAERLRKLSGVRSRSHPTPVAQPGRRLATGATRAARQPRA